MLLSYATLAWRPTRLSAAVSKCIALVNFGQIALVEGSFSAMTTMLSLRDGSSKLRDVLEE